MVKVREDLTGKKFGRLTVLEQAEDYVSPNGKHYPQWLCECSCSEHNQVIVYGRNLKNGNTLSCGCIHRERMIEVNKKSNIYNLSGEFGIGLTSNTGTEFYFDLEDYDLIKDYCWREDIDDKGYHHLAAWDSEKKKRIFMHWLILDKYCDHANRNPLDNRKSNLRKATFKENSRNQSKSTRNTSGVVGVGWYKRYNKWVAYIKTDKRITIGYFDNKDDAIRARLNAEARYFGEFAPQKHLYEQYGINTEQND